MWPWIKVSQSEGGETFSLRYISQERPYITAKNFVIVTENAGFLLALTETHTPRPKTINPEPEILHLKPQSRNLKFYTSNLPEPEILLLKPSTNLQAANPKEGAGGVARHGRGAPRAAGNHQPSASSSLLSILVLSDTQVYEP